MVLLSFLSLLFLQSSSSSYDRRDGKIVSVFVPVYHPFLFSTVHQQISVAVNFFLSFLPSRPEPHPSSRTFFCFNLAFLIFYSPSLSRFLSLYRFFLDAEGKRVYTLNKTDPAGKPTISAHPARFSPDDKYSRHRVTLKKRFGVLLTDSPAVPL